MMLNQRGEGLMSGLCRRDQRNARRLFAWTLAWGLSFMVAAIVLGPPAPWASGWPFVILAVPIVAGILMFGAYLRFLQQADELVRLILLRAAAYGFGVSFALGVVFSLAGQFSGQWEDAGAITWVAGFLTFEFRLLGLLKQFDAQPSA